MILRVRNQRSIGDELHAHVTSVEGRVEEPNPAGDCIGPLEQSHGRSRRCCSVDRFAEDNDQGGIKRRVPLPDWRPRAHDDRCTSGQYGDALLENRSPVCVRHLDVDEVACARVDRNWIEPAVQHRRGQRGDVAHSAHGRPAAGQHRARRQGHVRYGAATVGGSRRPCQNRACAGRDARCQHRVGDDQALRWRWQVAVEAPGIVGAAAQPPQRAQ